MASSCIEFHDRGFWIRDYMMEISLSFVLHVSQSEFNRYDWTESLIETMKLNSLGYFPGYMDLDLDEHLIDDSRKGVLIGAIKKTIDFLNDKYDMLIPLDDPNAFIENEELQTRWYLPLEKSRIVKVLESLILIIRGKLATTASDPMAVEF